MVKIKAPKFNLNLGDINFFMNYEDKFLDNFRIVEYYPDFIVMKYDFNRRNYVYIDKKKSLESSLKNLGNEIRIHTKIGEEYYLNFSNLLDIFLDKRDYQITVDLRKDGTTKLIEDILKTRDLSIRKKGDKKYIIYGLEENKLSIDDIYNYYDLKQYEKKS